MVADGRWAVWNQDYNSPIVVGAVMGFARLRDEDLSFLDNSTSYAELQSCITYNLIGSRAADCTSYGRMRVKSMSRNLGIRQFSGP